VIIINVKKSEILTMFDKKSKIILDTNMYIFNYEYITGKIPKYDCPEKTKRENVFCPQLISLPTLLNIKSLFLFKYSVFSLIQSSP
jgi:hypothetical protein